jgi:hypothetical protein
MHTHGHTGINTWINVTISPDMKWECIPCVINCSKLDIWIKWVNNKSNKLLEVYLF